MLPFEKIAMILRTDKDVVKTASNRLAEITGHDDVLARIVEYNNQVLAERLERLGARNFVAGEIYHKLLEKVRRDDVVLFEHLHRPVCDSEENCRPLLSFAKELANVGKGYFLKEEKAREFLEKEPPPNTLRHFKLSNVRELFKKFSLYEIYSALRFVEDREWLNFVFFKQLESVTPQDFEEREIEIHVLSSAWRELAAKFIKAKFHNVSHLKEFGTIFIIPSRIDIPGEAFRTFGLLLHYFHEVSFYSKLFRKFARDSQDDFSQNLVSSLRGDVLDSRFSEEDRGLKWMIVQRYLAKEDPYDWRLFEPHVHSEAIHYSKAAADIARLGGRFPELGLDFWENLDYVGDYFKSERGAEVLISFNLMDAVMSLVQEKEQVKHFYHQQEALWNKIFSDYLGKDKLEELIINNFHRGFIDLTEVNK